MTLLLTVEEAARALSVSRSTFERWVIYELRLVRVGRRLLVPASELERFVEERMSIPLVAELDRVPSRKRAHG